MDVDGDPWSDDEAVVCIPFSPQSSDSKRSLSEYPSSKVKSDLPHGPQARYAIYSEAWETLHDHLKAAARQTYAPILANVLDVVKKHDTDIKPNSQWVQNLMPSRELPVAFVVGDDKQAVFDELASEITKNDDLVLSTLVPSNFTSLQVTLKALIEGFIRNYDDKKRRTASALAVHDMRLLCSWYQWLSAKGEGPRLVVLIQDIEICTTSVVHDLFHICSNYAEQLPFTFVIGASSSDVMTTMFSRATRTLVTVKRFAMPNEHEMFDSLMQELFFNPLTFPTLILSGKTLSWLYHSWSSYHGSLHTLVSHLQLIYIRHFQNPLAILWNDYTLGMSSKTEQKKLAKNPAAKDFLQDLKNHLSVQQDIGASTEGLMEAAGTSSTQLRHAIREAIYAFRILRDVQAYLRDLSTQQHAVELSASFVRLAEQFGDGKLNDVASRLLKRTRLLDRRQLLGLLERIKNFALQITDTEVELVGGNFLTSIEELWSALATAQQIEEDARLKHPFSEDLASLLDQLWQSMSSWRALPMSEVWRTSDAEIPIDLLNPSMRSTVLTSLLQPGDYLLHDLARYTKPSSKLTKVNGKGKGKGRVDEVVVDPDICILFSRYANAGRTINVYDWFESFVQGVEATRPRKVDPPKGKGKGSKSTTIAGREEAEEAWRRELYGRFMWAIHEMDMLGLLRWTGRGTGKKGAECAGKVVWVVPE